MMTALDNPDEVEVREPHVDVDVVMFRLDLDIACDGDRYLRGQLYANSRVHSTTTRLWGRPDLLVDPDGTVRYA